VVDALFDPLVEDPDPTSPPSRRRRRRWPWVVLGILVVVLAVIGAAVLWLRSVVSPTTGGPEVAVEIPLGSGHTAIAELLADRGIVKNGQVFRFYLRFTGAEDFQAGSYRFRTHMAMDDAVTVLEAGPALPPAVNVTVPEGLTLDQAAAAIAKRLPRLSAASILAEVSSGGTRSKYQPQGKPLEGLLFPDTYRVEARDDAAALVERMVATFDQVAGSLGYDDAKAKVGLTPYEVVVVASLIEAEAKVDDDRAKIARVIYNRLERGMTLGIDAAFYYVLPPERRGTALRQSDLDRDTPYNTRLHAGLVPTPIMAPGKASLAAALNPEPGPWIFYVLKDERVHAFSDNEAQFQRDVAAARKKGLL
jgi:UPF0755 protein